MYLGSRIAKRGRAAVNVSLVSTPREPLLFLYPQWGKNSSSAAPSRANNDSTATTLHTRLETKHPSALSTHHGSKASKTNANAATVRTQTKSSSASIPSAKVQGTRHGSKSSKMKDVTIVRTQANLSSLTFAKEKNNSRKAVARDSKHSRQPSQVDTHLYQPLPILSELPRPPQTPGSEALLGKIKFPLEAPSKVYKPSTVLEDIERRVRRIMYAAEHAQRSEQSARAIREEFQEYRRDITDNWTPDWRKILDSLIANTPTSRRWYEQQIQIIVPPQTTQHLLTGVDTFIWDIGEKYGCSIALGHGQDTKQIHGVFILSGSKSAISRTLADVLLIAPDAKIMTCDRSAQRADPKPRNSQLALLEPQQVRSRRIPRPVIAFTRGGNSYEHPDEVPKPSTWTQQSLLDYITDLTSNPPNGTARYPQATVDTLSSLFKDPDPDLRAAITRTACHKALRYFVSANRMLDVRVLFVRMELFHLQLTPETFNIMLRGVAKQRDIHNFHFILHLMIKRGFLANGHTWIAFMMALDDFQMKVHVAIAMKSTGLLMHKSIMKGVCEQLIQPEVELSLDAGQDQQSFVAHMDGRYGRDWLTLDSGNLVLDVLGSRGLISRCWDFLHFMDSRFIRPDQYTLNTILNHCKQTSNLAGAIELMQNMSPAWGLQPNQETFRILFYLAWLSRNFNVAKVVWKYACMAGLTERTVRTRVKNSMRAAWHLPFTPRRRWTYYAGSVVFGTYGGLHPMRAVGHNTGTMLLDPKQRETLLNSEMVLNGSMPIPRLKSGIGPFPPNPEPVYKPFKYSDLPFKYVRPEVIRKNVQYMSKEFKYDIYLPKYMVGLAPRFSFEKMLGDAWTRDKQWREDGTYRTARLRWLIAKAVRVPLKAKWSEDVPDILL